MCTELISIAKNPKIRVALIKRRIKYSKYLGNVGTCLGNTAMSKGVGPGAAEEATSDCAIEGSARSDEHESGRALESDGRAADAARRRTSTRQNWETSGRPRCSTKPKVTVPSVSVLLWHVPEFARII